MSLGGPCGDTRVDGLRGDECNDKNLTDSNVMPPTACNMPATDKLCQQGRFCVNDEAQDHCPYDPNHSFSSTTERIFGCEWGKTPHTPCTVTTMVNGSNDMSGFVASARR